MPGNPVSTGGELAELKTHIITKLLWDPNLDSAALFTEFLQGYYGAAAGEWPSP